MAVQKQYVFLLICVLVFVACGNTMPTVTDDSETSDLEALNQEANAPNDVFHGAWNKAEKAYKAKTNIGVSIYQGVLNEAEIRIIMAYTYEKPAFYRALNEDLRTNFQDLAKQRYPQATRVLTKALTKLREVQDIPVVLYRNENKEIVLPIYKSVQESGTRGILKQFTSTSRSRVKAWKFSEGPTRLISTFKFGKVGADIDDFSDYSEDEILIPPNENYEVQSFNVKSVLLTVTSSQNGMAPWHILFIVCITFVRICI